MPLKTRRPPGHASRKALAYATDILNLRAQGHSLDAIRQALADAGLVVGISTVRREVLRGAAPVSGVQPPASQAETLIRPTRRHSASVLPSEVVQPAPTAALPGKAEAEAFMRGHPINALLLQEHRK